MFILETLNFVVDILKVPSVLVGLIALCDWSGGAEKAFRCGEGTIKTILGFIVAAAAQPYWWFIKSARGMFEPF